MALLLSIACAGVLTFVLGSRVLAGTEDRPDASLGIDWALTPASVDELTANSQIVVTAYPIGVTDGEPIAIEEPAGLPPIPTRLTDFAVTDGRLTTRTPLDGPCLCSAATHPAGSVIALNGRNAAAAVLADQGAALPA